MSSSPAARDDRASPGVRVNRSPRLETVVRVIRSPGAWRARYPVGGESAVRDVVLHSPPEQRSPTKTTFFYVLSALFLEIIVKRHCRWPLQSLRHQIPARFIDLRTRERVAAHSEAKKERGNEESEVEKRKRSHGNVERVTGRERSDTRTVKSQECEWC